MTSYTSTAIYNCNVGIYLIQLTYHTWRNNTIKNVIRKIKSTLGKPENQKKNYKTDKEDLWKSKKGQQKI